VIGSMGILNIGNALQSIAEKHPRLALVLSVVVILVSVVVIAVCIYWWVVR